MKEEEISELKDEKLIEMCDEDIKEVKEATQPIKEEENDNSDIIFSYGGEQYAQVTDSIEKLIKKYKLDNKEQLLLHLIKEFDS